MKELQATNDRLGLEVGKIKGMLAREKERCEDISTDLEVAEMKLKVNFHNLTLLALRRDAYLEGQGDNQSKTRAAENKSNFRE
jgi:hypothetical protein